MEIWPIHKNLIDNIYIELFFFIVMLSKRVNGKLKNAWYEFELIPLTCLYRYSDASFILYDIIMKIFYWIAFCYKFKNMFCDLSDIIHQLSTYTKHSDTQRR